MQSHAVTVKMSRNSFDYNAIAGLLPLRFLCENFSDIKRLITIFKVDWICNVLKCVYNLLLINRCKGFLKSII